MAVISKSVSQEVRWAVVRESWWVREARRCAEGCVEAREVERVERAVVRGVVEVERVVGRAVS